LHGEFFDDALAYDADFETSPVRIRGRIVIKRLWRTRQHALYARYKETGQFVRLLTANFSWLPDYLWGKLGPFSLTPAQDARVQCPEATELKELNLAQPLTSRVSVFLRLKFFEFRRSLIDTSRRPAGSEECDA
jgi:hypothetical protein